MCLRLEKRGKKGKPVDVIETVLQIKPGLVPWFYRECWGYACFCQQEWVFCCNGDVLLCRVSYAEPAHMSVLNSSLLLLTNSQYAHSDALVKAKQ